jgi:hypothetical protein
MDAPRGIHVDHKDNDGLNCQQNNLRFATPAQSAYDVKWAQMLLKFRFEDATEAIKKAMATDACQHEMTATRIKEANRDALKERIRALEQVLSVQQSRLRHMEEAERAF